MTLDEAERILKARSEEERKAARRGMRERQYWQIEQDRPLSPQERSLAWKVDMEDGR